LAFSHSLRRSHSFAEVAGEFVIDIMKQRCPYRFGPLRSVRKQDMVLHTSG
jgi:hypothetical protein